MKMLRKLSIAIAALGAVVLQQLPVSGETAPTIASMTRPQAGAMQMLFHGGTGPFQIQKRLSVDPTAPWYDIPEAKVTQVNTGVYMAFLPMGSEDAAFYRVLSVGETIVELKGWSLLMKVSSPANGLYFVAGESPVVTITLLDNFAQGLSAADFSSLNLYMYGPQDPQKTVTAVKLLNASTNRANRVHHYIDLKTNPGVQLYNNVFTYQLQQVTDEAAGTYRLSLWAVRGSDTIQQLMRFTDIQIGTNKVEQAVIAKATCAACHEGAMSGKTYMHHIDPGFSPTGNWALDYLPEASCASCHNNDGYAAYTDTNAPGGKVPDTFVRRAHGVHMGEELRLPFNTNSVNGDFKDYTHVVFPADIRDCRKCHVDDRWKTKPSRIACGSCHDTTWFGDLAQLPPGAHGHGGGPVYTDTHCSVCHPADGVYDPPNDMFGVAGSHEIPAPRMNGIDTTMTPPANGKYYVAGERPVVSMVFKNDAGNSIGDHTKVTTANYSTARLFVYGPRQRAVPVLTSTAKYGVDTARASVTCTIDGPWAISNKVIRIGINGTPPQDYTIVGTSNLVTAAQVCAVLNPVITNLNGGAKATVSGARVNIKSLIRGANARIEIYNGEVTTAMGWKAKGVVLEPDVAVASVSTPGNDLRPVADPLDFADPMVTRTTTNILYQLDDVAGLPAGTYNIYAYYLPVAGKVTGVSNLTGIGHMMFQVGTATAEKKVATNCKDCHGETIFHLASGPIHAEPFDTDYCNACHDYGHPNTGDMFKNQGGTSLNGWSGYGAMPISRRVHGVHNGNYLEHPEEIYANATVDTFGHIIFPQDIRNCTSCHAETDTWKQKPARMACLACHDSDQAKVHGLLMTYIPDPSDPYGPKAQESCEVCHGANKAYSPDKVHNITNPYVPPYPRAPRGE